MLAFLSNELLAMVMRALPRFFLVGAPVLVAVVAAMALVDAKIPGCVRPE